MTDGHSFDELNRRNVAIVEKAIGAINRGDSDALLALFSDDIRFWMPGSTPVSGRTRGKEEFLDVFAKVAEQLDELITLEVTNLIPAGNWVVTECRGDSLTRKGDRYRNTYCHLWKIEDERITEFTEYNDTELVTDVLFR